jgi:hypothetical protein
MAPKNQKIILWVCYALLIVLSAGGFLFCCGVKNLIPMALNDSSPNFSQIADDDRWAVYHQAQHLMMNVILVTLVVTVLWATLAAFAIRLLFGKSSQT